MKNKRVSLCTGNLNISSAQLSILDDLTGFGSRINPKRGFVFVSKVLGKHYPATPQQMQASHQQLAAKIKPLLQVGKTLVIGFAETATGLGQGVFEQLGLTNACYTQTTRYPLSQPVWLTFEEEHSHATAHKIYRLEDKLSHYADAKNIVLVDDEFSTGKTILNLAQVLRKKNKGCHLIAASLLNWKSSLDPGIHWVSLFRGQFDFTAKNMPLSMPVAEANCPLLDTVLVTNYSRLGVQYYSLETPKVIDKIEPQESVLCLGTSEYMHGAYQLARLLATRGIESYVQSTTRSPLNVDQDITHKLIFKDNYYEGINHYLYNLRSYDRIIVCYETRTLPAHHDLLQQLTPYADSIHPVYPKVLMNAR